MVAPVGTYKVRDVAQYIKRQFGDESGVQIIDSDIIRWINLGLVEVVAKTPFLEKTAFTPITGSNPYALPADIINIKSIYVGNRIVKMVNMQEALETIKSNIDETGQPEFYWTDQNNVYLWPVPTPDKGNVVIYYQSMPSKVATLTDLIPIPDFYYARLLEYVLSEAYSLDEDEKSLQLRQVFDAKLNEQYGRDQDNARGGLHVVVESDYYDNDGWW